MVEILKADPNRIDQLKQNPIAEIEKLSNEAKGKVPAYTGDVLLYRIAVTVLGALALLAVLGGLILALGNRTVPEGVVAIGSAAAGALVGLFAPSPTGK
jgi:hypothetical protein